MTDEVITPVEELPTKKKRGRPPKVATEDASDIVSSDAPTSAPKTKRGRKPKSSINKEKIAKQLQGFHALAALLTQLPDLAIDDDEAEGLVDSVVNVAEQYDISLSGKTAAWLALAGTAAMVYVPRAIVISKKIQMAKMQHIPEPPAGTV